MLGSGLLSSVISKYLMDKGYAENRMVVPEDEIAHAKVLRCKIAGDKGQRIFYKAREQVV